MGVLTVEVRNRLVGGSRGGTDVPVVLELGAGEITAAELLRTAVAAQIQELRVNRGLAPDDARRILARLYHIPDVSSDSEVESAIQGFAQRAFVMLVNGRQIEQLDDVLELRSTNRVTFLRLMAFSGG
jgi:hypothetical protein